LDQIGRAERAAPLPGAPGFARRREELLARAKAAPVFWLSAPKQAATEDPVALRLRAQLAGKDSASVTLYALLPTLLKSRELAREVLLSQGYLYTESPSLAFGMTYVLKLEHLFDAPRLWLQRGDEALELAQVRAGKDRHYVYVNGVEAGQRASLLFLDRVGPLGENAGLPQGAAPLHRDARALRKELGFDALSLRHLGAQQLVAELHYGELRVLSLLEAAEVRVSLKCEAVVPEEHELLRQFRARRRAELAGVSRLQAAIREQILERAMFDEPRTEEGQQDGKLREAWTRAYTRGWASFLFNGDRYPVFDHRGRAIPPQVCIDFIYDTIERASGSWWRPRGEAPGKSTGGFLLSAQEIGHQRRVQAFVSFARNHPDWFEVLDLPEEERVPLRRRETFFAKLAERKRDFQPGDIVVIYGMREDDPVSPHYHSFYVYESDPLSGMPIHVASNAVVPQIRTWEGELQNAPRRTLRVRVRPRPEWLYRISQSHSSVLAPAPDTK
jgi:hypothetical protein